MRSHQRVMSSYGVSRAVLFEQVDKPALKPLPIQPLRFARWKSAKVKLDYHLEIDKHYYSVPYWFVQREVQVKLTEHLIEVFHDHQRIAVHERSRVQFRQTTMAEHMPPEHWAYKRQSKERFIAWAQHISTHTTLQVEAIFNLKAHEEQAFRSIRGLQRLATQYGSARLESACRRANAFGMVGLRRLRSILVTHLDTAPVELEPAVSQAVDHDNLRGAQYYH